MASSSEAERSNSTEAPEERIRTLERRLRLTRLHRRVAVAANEARTAEEALRIGVAEICRVTNWPVGHAFLRDEEGCFRPTGGWYGADPTEYPVLRDVSREALFEPSEGLIGRVGARGCPEWIRDIRADSTFLRGRDAPIEVRGVLAVPLVRTDEVLGVIEFFSDAPRIPEPDLLEILSDVGRQLAVVVTRANAERELRISERKFSGIVEVSADAIVSVDEDHRIVEFNHGAGEIFGYEADEILGRPLDLLIPPSVRARHRAHVRDFGSGPDVARRMGERRKVQGVRKSGESFPAEASIAKLEVAGERIYSVVLRDVSDRIEYEEALRQHARKLSHSNEELERFAFVASHDLQEPLRKIRTFARRMVELYGEELDPRGRDYLGRMEGAAERMASLIGDLLRLSRVSTEGRPLVRVDLGRVIDDVLSDLEHQISDTGGKVDVGPLPPVRGDSPQLRQLFQNLIENALKYHRKGVAPRVVIEGRTVVGGAGRGGEGGNGERAGGDGGQVRVRVRDHGIGFEAEDGERIFGIFERLHGRSAYDGTGVGLAICQKIVERHGGTIRAEGVPGEGATFVVTLPAAKEGAAEGPNAGELAGE